MLALTSTPCASRQATRSETVGRSLPGGLLAAGVQVEAAGRERARDLSPETLRFQQAETAVLPEPPPGGRSGRAGVADARQGKTRTVVQAAVRAVQGGSSGARADGPLMPDLEGGGAGGDDRIRIVFQSVTQLPHRPLRPAACRGGDALLESSEEFLVLSFFAHVS